MTIRSIAAAVMFAGALMVSAKSFAEERVIHVNGVRMNAIEIAVLDYLNCGDAVPNGRYWLDEGAWGYEGGARQGYLPECDGTDAGTGERGHSRYREDRVFENYGLDMI